MRLVFLSNYFNHHQKFISNAFFRNSKYCFIATTGIPEFRKKLGYHMEQLPDYVCPVYMGESFAQQAGDWIRSADVVITGAAPEEMIQQRIREGKLVFRYAERPLKLGFQVWKYPYRFIKWHRRNPSGKPVYMLCASAYTAGDYRRFGLFQNRTYKWGYFPETKRYDDVSGLLSGKIPAEILWCGRFLDWKHPDDALKATKQLREEGYTFRLKYIGAGPMEESLRRMTAEMGLSDCVEFLGTMTPERVREHMEKAGIYLFTSDKKEGWGAVLNESMNSGCAVIASHAIGSVPFLLRDGENGLVYCSGDVQMLYEKIQYLLDNPLEQRRLGRAAYETIEKEWNAEEAGRRFVKLAQAILDGDKFPDLYETGPCSRAIQIQEAYSTDEKVSN